MFNTVAANFEQYMNLLSSRQKLVASNLANADTPGYKTKDIDFQNEFASAMADAGGPAANVQDVDLASRNDGNNVNIDREARLLAENGMRFQLVSMLAHGQIKSIKSALQEGRS